MTPKSTPSLQQAETTFGDSVPAQKNARGPVPLQKWLWGSYLRSAIVPLFFIELTFLAIYWVSNSLVYKENITAVSAISDNFLTDVAVREATSISNELSGISAASDLFARQTLKALRADYSPPESEKRRYAFSPQGAFYTKFDNGTTASFYSGIMPIGPEQIRKVWKLSALDPLMIDIKNSNQSIVSLYFNTFDSYNRIYPYIPGTDQYPAKMDIPKYNFYYEADEKHNPARKAVWTDAYIDPAGHGWMVSSIAPVWNGNKLEGVVGLDVTLDTVIRNLLNLKLPWDAYAILVDRDGRIVAMPPEGEEDFGLKELTNHHYSEAILSDTFKPDTFNIFKRQDVRPLAEAMRRGRSGEVDLNLNEPHQASFATIAGPEWRLVIIAPTKAIRADANRLRDRLELVGVVMVAGLLVFYVGFFLFLYQRAKVMSQRVASPLEDISGLIRRIGLGDYRQEFAGSEVSELNDVGERLAHTGHQLGDAQQRIIEQERLLSRALTRQRLVNEEQVRFVRMISHELRTPLSVIDSGAQIIGRKAETLAPADLQGRATKLRKAVQRISDLLHKLVESSIMDNDHPDNDIMGVHLPPLVMETAASIVPPERLRLDLPDCDVVTADSATVAIALRTVLDNALLYSAAGSPVTVSLNAADGVASIQVTDTGPGIPEDELPQVGQRFFRGTATTGKEGAGIGIHMARKLLERIEGRIDITSGGDIPGTVATILIPVRHPATAETA